MGEVEAGVVILAVIISRIRISIISTWGTLTIFLRTSSEEKILSLVSSKMMTVLWTSLSETLGKWASEAVCKCTVKWIMAWEIWGTWDNKSKNEVEIHSLISARWDKWASQMMTTFSEEDLEGVDLAVVWWWALTIWEEEEVAAFPHTNRVVFLGWAVEWENP